MNEKINLTVKKGSSFNETESYKKLRSNLQFIGKDVRVISFISTLQNEGKSEVSFNLALSMAEMGKNVLYIDTDLRNSVFINKYNITQPMFGLAHYLIGEKSFDEVIYETNVNHLSIISIGAYPPNPSELLAQEAFSDLLETAKRRYDYIIIDTAPLGLVIDGAIVSRAADGTVIVIEQGRISFKFAKATIEQLQKSNCRILGAVLNKYSIDKKNKDSYYYYGYGYNYEVRDKK